MEVQHFLEHTLIYLATAILLVPIAARLRLGAVLGYLIGGLLIGPSGFKFIQDAESVFHFAEFGVVILLFLIGLELQPEKLWRMRKYVVGLGLLQVVATTFILGFGFYLLVRPSITSAFMVGFGLAMSSTAFALQLLTEHNETKTHHGHAGFSVLLFQDMSVIPVLAIIPLLAISANGEGTDFNWLSVLKGLGAIVTVILAGRFILRPVLRYVATLRLKEIFTATALFVVIGTGVLMVKVGLSMALGAFLAGVLLADSEYRHELEADLEAFKGLFLGLFFIAVGMSLDLPLLIAHPFKVIAIILGFTFVKAAVLFGIGKWSKMPGMSAIRFAALLSQGGEFAFVLFKLAQSQNTLLPEETNLLILAVTLSMAASPLIYRITKNLLLKTELNQKTTREFDSVDEANPVIIAGFGRFGQVVGRVLRMKGIGITALEHDPEHVETIRKFGSKVFYGDASRLDLLEAAGAKQAKLFILAIDDPDSSVATAEVLTKHFPHLKIFARARNRAHVFRLRDLGITDIVRETFHSSLLTAELALHHLGDSRLAAQIACNYFQGNDEKLLDEQYKNYHEEEHMIAVSKLATEQLVEAFRADQRES